MRRFILITGVLMLGLLWTNPKPADFEKWVYDQEAAFSRNNPNMEPVDIRSKNYLFFSYYELTFVRHRDERMTTFAQYAGIGFFKMIFPVVAPNLHQKKSPVL